MFAFLVVDFSTPLIAALTANVYVICMYVCMYVLLYLHNYLGLLLVLSFLFPCCVQKMYETTYDDFCTVHFDNHIILSSSSHC